MRRMRIIILIFTLMLASVVSEVKASKKQNIVFPINKSISLSEDINNNKKFQESLYAIETEKIIDPLILPISPTLEIEKQKLISKGFKSDYLEIYKNAANRFGLDWQILTAIHKVETGQRGDTFIKSFKGATGPMQFLPSTFKAYAIDGDNDGILNINDIDDAIFTAANYLSKNNEKGGINYAIYRYNHSQSYVNKVKSLASLLY